MASTHEQQSPTMAHCATMNDLPNEMLLYIFKHLKIQDLIRCRLVCKKIMLICIEVNVRELIVSDKIENFKEYWFHTHDQLNHKDAIDLRTFKSFRSIFRFDEFVERLHFKGSYSDFVQLRVNNLTHLKQLKVDVSPSNILNSRGKEVIAINLPNLKKLEVGDDYDDQFEIYLAAPQLEMLKCYECKAIHVAHPNTIIRLETVFYSLTATALKSVRYLKVDWGFIPSREILTDYPKLTTLVCNHFEYDENGAFINGLSDLVEQKGIVKRSELKIYYQSVEVADSIKIDEYMWAEESTLSFQINNYESLCDSISHDNPLDYKELMRLVRGNLPKDFHQKYFNTPSVRIRNKVRNPQHLVWFLKNLEYLNTLDLHNVSLDQTFYDGLHEIGHLTELMEKKNSIANYDFLFKLKCLETFSTDRDHAAFFDLTFALFRALKYFRCIHFYFKKEFIAISKEMHTNEYTFRRYQDTNQGRRENLFERCGMNLDHLVRLVNAYKIRRSISSNQSGS